MKRNISVKIKVSDLCLSSHDLYQSGFISPAAKLHQLAG